MASMGNMGVGIPGEMGGGMPVDTGGMGIPPVAVPDDNEMMLQALLSVLQKWESQEGQLAGEKGSLMQALMLIAGAAPPSAEEAMVAGGDPSAYGMEAGY